VNSTVEVDKPKADAIVQISDVKADAIETDGF
jgi:hypothetical protein